MEQKTMYVVRMGYRLGEIREAEVLGETEKLIKTKISEWGRCTFNKANMQSYDWTLRRTYKEAVEFKRDMYTREIECKKHLIEEAKKSICGYEKDLATVLSELENL